MKLPTLALVLLALIAGVSFAQSKVPQYALDANGKYVDPDGIWRWVFLSKGIPINMSYEEMTPAQQALVRAQYTAMPEGDEPPFPKDGLETLIRVAIKLQRATMATGSLNLLADIGADGVPVSVRILQTPDQSVGRVVAEAILLTPFKPGRCSERPCRMAFPFHFVMSVNPHE